MNLNPFDILKNAQKLQEQMGEFQEKLDEISATGSAGAGMVEIDINGKMEVLAVRISQDALSDAEMLQDLVMAAFTDAMSKVREEINEQLGAMTGGMNIPGLNIPGLS